MGNCKTLGNESLHCTRLDFGTSNDSTYTMPTRRDGVGGGGYDDLDIAESSKLVQALQRVRDSGKKSLIKSTDHHIVLEDDGGSTSSSSNNGPSQSALIEEAADDEDDEGVESKTMSIQNHLSNNTMTLTSWKTQEFAYRKTNKIGYEDDDELPTLARGLFTCSDLPGKHRIVVRGYDKFFNEGEMHWTRPGSIAAYSRPPYELSFKENGCIIFIAALSNHQLIVTSKHSLGAHDSQSISHAQKGEEWLDRHLRSAGKSKRELAQYLWNRNETAVAELCDDLFEEHVLAYPPERTGLHLHGLNSNTAQFQTRSMKEVEVFARQWGFLPTRCLVMNSIEEVNKFTHVVAETGRWEGIAIEGFVVRTRMPTSQDIDVNSGKANTVTAPPYASGQSWFYKVKFDEPYLMYRDWRELTRKMLSEKEAYDKAIQSGGQLIDRPEPVQVKKKRVETQLYVLWCHEKIYGSKDGSVPANSELFEKMHQNQGIIRLRDLFLEYLKTSSMQAKVNLNEDLAPTIDKRKDVPFNKTLIVPIAVPGCGKTALAIALKTLFPTMGHTQSDDVQTKKTGPTFLKNILKELEEHDVIFADRNNHLYKHRDEIVKSVEEWESAATRQKNQKQKQANKKKQQQQKEQTSVVEEEKSRHVRLVAIVWSLEDLPLNAIHHLCSDRLVERGANHQSLRAESGKEHEQVLWQFLQTREAFDGNIGEGDSAFDNVIRLELQSTFEQSILDASKQLSVILAEPPPSKEKVNEAIEQARQYKVNVIKELKKVVGPSIRYYGLSLELDLVKTVQSIVIDDERAQKAFQTLVKANRVINRPHVTLVHSSELPRDSQEPWSTSQQEAQSRWDFYSTLFHQSKSAVPFDMQIDCLAWDDRAMALGISKVTSKEHQTKFQALQGKGWRPHITIGTFGEDIRPYEGKRVLCEADAGTDTVHCFTLKESLPIQGRLRGLN